MFTIDVKYADDPALNYTAVCETVEDVLGREPWAVCVRWDDFVSIKLVFGLTSVSITKGE
jgi:hypothetical protein